jgi:hypothetical protein
MDLQLKHAMLCCVEFGSGPVGGVGHLELIVAVWAAREFASSPLG